MSKYVEMLAGRGLKIGDKVVCKYRTPATNQWWIHPFWVGVIEDVSTERIADRVSEAHMCEVLKRAKVRYLGHGTGSFAHGFTDFDELGHLMQLHFCEELTESPYFADSDHAKLVWFASQAGLDYRIAA